MFRAFEMVVDPRLTTDDAVVSCKGYERALMFGMDLLKLCLYNGKYSGSSQAARTIWKIEREKLKKEFPTIDRVDVRVERTLNSLRMIEVTFTMGWRSVGGYTPAFYRKVWFGSDGNMIM